MKRMKKICAFGLAFTLAIGLCACSGSSDSTGKTTDGDNNEEETPVKIQSMFTNAIETLDAQAATDETSMEVIANFTDGLKQQADDGSIVNALCAEESVSDDKTVYTFTLREDATWSNGEPVTAHDFVCGWQRAVNPDNEDGNPNGYLFSDVAQIKGAAAILAGKKDVSELGVRAIDDYTLEVTLKCPVDNFDELLCLPAFYPACVSYVESAGEDYATDCDHVLSNGAFTLTDYDTSTNWIQFEKNEDYYDADSITVSELNYKIVQDSQSAILDYEDGHLDTITLSGEHALDDIEDASSKSIDTGALWYLSPNTVRYKELDNKNLRKALTYAIDRDSLTNDILNNGSTAAYSAVATGVDVNPKNDSDFTSGAEYSDYIGYDTKLAQKYLKKAFKQLGVTAFELELLVDDDETSQALGAAIKSQIESTLSGVTISLRIEPKAQRLADQADGNYCLALTCLSGYYSDASAYLEAFTSSKSNSRNYGALSDEKYDFLIYSVLDNSLSSAKACYKSLKKAEERLMKQAVMIPLYQEYDMVFTRSSVSNVVYHNSGILRSFKHATKDMSVNVEEDE
ncbi:MAG: peptide ABC transporter substrate-binding protein [Eubacterium sp.]|nr:peptide ABC transporter substrate-binding protein [Eubacterium sp.]